MNPFAEQLPPHDIEAEEAVIAACMVPDGWAQMSEVAAMVSPSDFFREHHGWIFDAELDLWRRGKEPNQILVGHELARRDLLEKAGGQGFLTDVIRRLPTALGAVFYAEIVARTAVYRRGISLFTAAIAKAYEAPPDPSDVFDWASSQLNAMSGGSTKALTRSMAEILQGSDRRPGLIEQTAEFLDAPEEIRGLPTGWEELDAMLNGLVDSRLYVVLADTSVGKSFFCHFIAWWLARQGIPVHIVSTEMSDDEVAERMCYMEAGVDPEAIRGRGATDEEKQRIGMAQTVALEWPVYITAVGKIRSDVLEAEARRMHAKGCRALFVDHLQHIRVKGATGVAVIEEATSTVKHVAVSLGYPVVLVSHINRSSLDGGIGLHSGKGGSSIEQDANVVLTLEPVIQDEFSHELRVMTRKELNDFKARFHFVPIRLTSGKSRSGGQSVLYRKLAFSQGGRFIPMEETA